MDLSSHAQTTAILVCQLIMATGQHAPPSPSSVIAQIWPKMQQDWRQIITATLQQCYHSCHWSSG